MMSTHLIDVTTGDQAARQVRRFLRRAATEPDQGDLGHRRFAPLVITTSLNVVMGVSQAAATPLPSRAAASVIAIRRGLKDA